ncbi:hypothetical protein BC629DRAFT_1593623 [Irpex lacteus]|nr:hypothetical protein BC629DRAFT_1593623 [Irpex lacteus]
MSEEERRWWANPYLRMLASPMRRCIVTNTVQPADFMVRVAAMSVPASNSSDYTTALFPDGVEHPRYRGKRAGNGRWVLCYKDAVEHIIESKPIQRRYLNANLPADSLLAQHVGSVLRTRVIQELEILGEQLRCRPVHSQEVPVLRRLRRSELRQIKQDGILSLEGAVAVIIIPPLNKNPASKERPEPSTSAPPTISSSRDGTKTNKYPIAELYPVEHQQNSWEEGDSLTSMTSAKVPLYNGVSLFPESSQRAAFYQVLQNVMRIEREARHQQSPQLRSAVELRAVTT